MTILVHSGDLGRKETPPRQQRPQRAAAAAEFRATLAELGLAQTRVARWFGASPRSVRRWQYGDRRIPRGIDTVFRLLRAGMVTTDQLEQVTVPIPVRTDGSAEPEEVRQREGATDQADQSPPTFCETDVAIDRKDRDRSKRTDVAALARAKTAALAVYELSSDTCHWPLGDPQRPDFHFCGRPTTEPPYCKQHCATAYLAPRPQTGAGGQKRSSLTVWPPRTGSRSSAGRPSHDADGPRTAPVAAPEHRCPEARSRL